MKWLRWTLLVALASSPLLLAQDRLGTLPAYAQYQRYVREIPTAVQSGAVSATWTSPTSFEYSRGGKRYRFDVAAKHATEIAASSEPPRRGRGQAAAGEPERGRQYEATASPDGALTAHYRNRNVLLIDADGRETAVTTDGSAASRIKYGTASWVYGEELNQRDAMWWSPDSRKLAYYRFDESKVADFVMTMNETSRRPTLDTEAFPLAGEPNPLVDLYVYDVAAKQSVKVDVRDGKPFANDSIGHYVYRVQWSPDGRELLFLRANRRQNAMEVAAANPATGSVRVVLHEEWPSG
jgi:dipeptidyl-peptidase 4